MAESYTPPGMSVSYTVPELSDPADAPQAFRDFADSISGVQDTLTVTPVLGNITLAAGDDGTMLSCATDLGDIEITVPDNASVPLPVGFVVAVANEGGFTNVVKLKKGTGVNIQDQGFLQVEDYRITTLVKVSTDFWLVQAGSATYTPPAGPGSAVFDEGASTGFTFSTLTDPDGDGKNYRLATKTTSGAGSLVFSEGGYADYLCTGGGGGGRSSYGGGGAGAVRWGSALLTAGTCSVSVGAAGAASNNGGNTTIDGAGLKIFAGGGSAGRGNPNWPQDMGFGQMSGGGSGGGYGQNENGSYVVAGAGQGNNSFYGGSYTGIPLTITGTAVEYGCNSVGAGRGYGSGGDGGNSGYGGCVYVRVEI